MKDIMKNDFVKMITALLIVGVFSGMSLVFVYVYTQQKISNNQNMEMAKAIWKLFPEMDKAVVMNKVKGIDKNPAEIVDKNSKLLGYAFLAEGNGYQGVIKLMAGIGPDLSTLKGIEVLESQETPGLGAEIAGDKFKDQFNGLEVTHVIEYVKNQKPQEPYQIEAITGATISSRAVVNILNKRIEEVRKILKGAK
jgi:electron transport complex protein RnfG